MGNEMFFAISAMTARLSPMPKLRLIDDVEFACAVRPANAAQLPRSAEMGFGNIWRFPLFRGLIGRFCPP
jgi:hypothetical protein